MGTLSDIRYEEHRLIVLVALGFLVLGAIAPFPRIHKMSIESWVLLVFIPSAILVFAGGVVLTTLAWAGQGEWSFLFFAGPTCVLAWLTGMQVRNGALRSRSGAIALLPLLAVTAVLWTRDAPPALGATAATRVFVAHLGASTVGADHYVCRRYANGDDFEDGEYGLSGAQFECDPRYPSCVQHSCAVWWISLDGKGRIRKAVSPGGP
jgi:hypothetical protein